MHKLNLIALFLPLYFARRLASRSQWHKPIINSKLQDHGLLSYPKQSRKFCSRISQRRRALPDSYGQAQRGCSCNPHTAPCRFNGRQHSCRDRMEVLGNSNYHSQPTTWRSWEVCRKAWGWCTRPQVSVQAAQAQSVRWPFPYPPPFRLLSLTLFLLNCHLTRGNIPQIPLFRWE